MAITKITTPDLIDLPFNNTDGIVLAKGTTSTTVPVQYLVVAGGGGGGGASSNNATPGGGGGAGGLSTNYNGTSLGVSSNTPLDLTVGAAGAAGLGINDGPGGDGGNSIFSDIIITGGGGGAPGNDDWPNTSNPQVGRNGGSGGGGAYAGSGGTSTSNGNNGGDSAGGNVYPYVQGTGGGGGAGAVGSNGSGSAGGNGGDGLQNNIDGNNNYYAGGGGGSWFTGASYTGSVGTGGTGGGGAGGSGAVGVNGGNNTGGGGGAAGSNYQSITGGAGGSGVVILRTSSTTTATFVNATTTITQVGGGAWSSGDKIYTVTATTGVATVSFSSTALGTGRPTTNLSIGEFRYNTTTKKVEYYDGADWFALTSTTAVPQAGTTGACNYPTTASALYQLNSDGGVTNNVPDTCGSYDGTATSITYSTGNFGNAAVFNGSSSYITLPNSVEQPFILAQQFAVSIWFNIDALPTGGDEDFLISLYEEGYLDIRIKASGVIEAKVAEESSGTDRIVTSSSGVVSASTWHNVIWTGAANNLVLYVDGSSVATGSTWNGTFYHSNAGCSIGSKNNGTSNFFDGKIDQCRIFPSVLTQEQVTALATETAP